MLVLLITGLTPLYHSLLCRTVNCQVAVDLKKLFTSSTSSLYERHDRTVTENLSPTQAAALATRSEALKKIPSVCGARRKTVPLKVKANL